MKLPFNRLFHRVKKQASVLTSDAREFFPLLFFYIERKLRFAGLRFELGKRVIVEGLLMKRGRFARPFLHFGVGSLFAFGIIAAPVFASTYPILSQKGTVLSAVESPSAVLASVTDSESPLSTQISPKPRDEIIIYRVEKGDTLSSIANKFDISVDTILWENCLKSNDSISIDQEIRILPVSGVSHKVLKGDTVYSIAKKYSTEAQNIANFPFNDFADPDTFALTPGQILIVPDGAPPAAPSKPKPLPRIIAPSNLGSGGGGFIWPTSGGITQYPIWYHMAVDIANREAPAVAAAKGGSVNYAACVRGGYGCHVIIDHGDGMQTLYAHLSQIGIHGGADVSQGQVIGRMGSTGRSTGVHLHFEVRKNGVALNPLNFLK